MEEMRPSPDALLEHMERRPSAGRLKIFFGYAAGVGKTYAMLEAAHRAEAAGADVVAGYIEPHTRPETMELLEGLEVLQPRSMPYKGMELREFDLDAALTRRPQLLLVDELAHTNSEGCRHRKRYQDVQELLRSGIDVYTTVNVQHLESLNDVVASITGVTVAERIPDSVFDCAAQVEVVDLEPADLLERLQAGKIYRERQAAQAMGHFFTQQNLAALREIALRRVRYDSEKTSEAASVYENGGLKVDYAAGCAYLDGAEVHLTPIEYKLLCLLAKNTGKVLTHNYILSEVWGSPSASDTPSLRVFMATLRKKLEADPSHPRFIQTHIGVGYRMLRQNREGEA